MKCAVHSERGAAARCCVCKKPFCCECLTYIGGKMYCREHTAAAQASKIGYKSRRRAMLLCAAGFAGVGGLHRIYAGRLASGVIYLCTGGLLLVGTVCDLVLLYKGKLKDAKGNPII